MGKVTRTQLVTACRDRGLHVGGNKTVLQARLVDWAKKNEISNFEVNDISCLLQDSPMSGNQQTNLTKKERTKKKQNKQTRNRASSKPRGSKQSKTCQTRYSRTKTSWKVINLPDPIVVETDEQVKQIVGDFNEETEAMVEILEEIIVKHRNQLGDRSDYFLVLTYLINDFV